MARSNTKAKMSAIDTLEGATAELLQRAEKFTSQAADDGTLLWRRRYLFQAARRYGKAIDNFYRVNNV